jgi:hypothetical protein
MLLLLTVQKGMKKPIQIMPAKLGSIATGRKTGGNIAKSSERVAEARKQ